MANAESKFLALPRELRNIIYDYAFIDPEPQYICLANSQTGCRRITALSLARVCMQLRDEVHDIFYAGNTFYAYISYYSDSAPRAKALEWELYSGVQECFCPSLMRHIEALTLRRGWKYQGPHLQVSKSGTGWIIKEGDGDEVWLDITDPQARPLGQGFPRRDLCEIVQQVRKRDHHYR
ncbi:Hypothetical predicted protein [Lecanosticta acicola]|uniref:Uncharacterized protein n=1 Tax=Lecanosticta acicola TaxID=111012 RepID=A0AAI8YXS2_9PEZI|nr:Hypothetical predicted protein [Lecanosticta acicola]